MNRKLLGITLAWALTASMAQAQGWIQFINSPFSYVFLQNAKDGTTVRLPTDRPMVYGVFVDGQLTSGPLGTSSTAIPGIIVAPNPYPVFGFNPGDTVSMQIRGWSAEYGRDWQAAQAAGAAYGETDVRSVLLSVQPGTVIWQGATSTNASRFHSIVIVNGGLAIPDITVAEGSNGVAQALFTVNLVGPCPDLVTVDYATQDGTALAGQDYEPVSGTLEFAPGETAKTIVVRLMPDVPVEDDETFSVVLTRPVNAGLRKATGTAVVTEARVEAIRVDTAIVIHTVAGRRYSVERSSDFVNWSPVVGAENVAGTGGSMTIYDRGSGCVGAHYYRTRLLAAP